MQEIFVVKTFYFWLKRMDFIYKFPFTAPPERAKSRGDAGDLNGNVVCA